MSNKISLNNVINVTLLQNQKGLANVNTSALALITSEVPIPSGYGTYRVYKDSVSVARDFGSSSITFQAADAAFSQSPNLLTGKGYLVIIPRNQANPATAATLLSSGLIDLTQLTATDYKIKVGVDGASAADVAIGSIDATDLDTAADSLNSTAITAAGLRFSLSGNVSAARVTLKSLTTGATSEISIGTSVSSGTNIAPLLGLSGDAKGTAAGLESIRDAILRTYQDLPYFGIIYDVLPSDAELPALAALVQSLDRVQFIGASDSAKIAGIFTTLQAAGYTQTRCLYYGNSANAALIFAAAYAGLGLSTNFDVANTASTMNLKTLAGILADTTLNQTIIDTAQLAGVDVYADFGVLELLTSGANEFFDSVYISLAFKLRIKIAGFNYLATTNTKIPQTENGLNGLKSAYRVVCSLFVKNGSFAPGKWNSSLTFGNPADHIRNIADFGFFVYSDTIANQSQVQRELRAAPLVQIAAKSAGAIHTSDVVIFIEA